MMVELDVEVAERLAAFADSSLEAPLDMAEVARRAQRRRRRRRAASASGGAVVVLTLGGVAALLQPVDDATDLDAAAQEVASVEVDPSDGLVDGDVVEVVVSGLPETSSAAMCAADVSAATVGARCDARTMVPLETEGSVATFRVARSLQLADGERDCAAAETPCVIAVGVVDGPVVTVRVSFRAEVAVGPPELSVQLPAGGARDGDRLRVNGSGFGEGQEVPVVQCPGAVGEAGCTSLTTTTLVANAEGQVTGEMRVTRRLDTLSGSVDCAVSPCQLIAETPTSGPVAAAVAFAPTDAPLAQPGIAIFPSGPVAPDSSVKVVGTGFPPDVDIEVSTCAGPVDTDPGSRLCVGVAERFVRTDAAGAFVIPVYPLATAGLDCQLGCYIAWAPSHFPVLVHVPITIAN